MIAGLGLIVGHDGPFVTLEQLKYQLHVPFFIEVTVVMSWCIWMQRNDFFFRGIQPSQGSCLQHFKKEFALVILRANPIKKSLMSLWLEALV